MPGIKDLMWENRWNSGHQLPWTEIKKGWEQHWDMTKSVLVEKSPPNIIRAFEIEKFFQPSHFIATIRDPYAFCEGIRRHGQPDVNSGVEFVRRHNRIDMKSGAEFWARCATYQLKNIERLKNSIHFRYEDFADNPANVRTRLLDFLPELQDLDITKSFQTRSIRGRGMQRIYNFNREQVNRLSASDIKDINTVLKQHDHLMAFFGYRYLEPSVGQSLRYFKTTGLSKTLNGLRRPGKLAARLLDRRRQ